MNMNILKLKRFLPNSRLFYTTEIIFEKKREKTMAATNSSDLMESTAVAVIDLCINGVFFRIKSILIWEIL